MDWRAVDDGASTAILSAVLCVLRIELFGINTEKPSRVTNRLPAPGAQPVTDCGTSALPVIDMGRSIQ